jgi:hypothetical protein
MVEFEHEACADIFGDSRWTMVLEKNRSYAFRAGNYIRVVPNLVISLLLITTLT